MILLRWFAALCLLGAMAALFVWRRRELARQWALARLQSNPDSRAVPIRRAPVSSLRRPFRFPIIGLAALAAVTLGFFLNWPWHFIVAAGAVAGLIANQVEAVISARKSVLIERQLADAIDIMVGAVGAGAGVSQSLEAAARETKSPLRGELDEIVARIRLGDQATDVFIDFAERVPLETFLLFASTLAVHWEVGGELAPTLATISRTVRDRIETQRRIRSNIAQSQMSTIAILALTYLVALIVWRNNPEQMRQFLATSVGGTLVAGTIVMQAFGVLWMNAISKVKF